MHVAIFDSSGILVNPRDEAKAVEKRNSETAREWHDHYVDINTLEDGKLSVTWQFEHPARHLLRKRIWEDMNHTFRWEGGVFHPAVFTKRQLKSVCRALDSISCKYNLPS